MQRPAKRTTSALAALLCVASLPWTAAANSNCGTVETAESLRDRVAMIANGQWDQARRFLNTRADRDGVMFVAMTMHVIRYDDGSEGLPQERIDACIDDLNAAVPDTGLIFFQEGPTVYHDDSNLAESTYDDFCTIVNTDPVPNTVNCYFVPVYEGLCGVASFPGSNCQGVTTANGCAATDWNHSTFPHEVGHYFNLRHTHSLSGGGECVDGSNCASAGDGFCDTPADPNLAGLVEWETCTYIGDALDACGSGLPYAPDPNNIMSYSSKPCRTVLSAEQQSMIAWTALNNEHRVDELRDPGACCLPSGCTLTASTACDAVWFEGITCLEEPCSPVGACCVGSFCLEVQANDCNGTWLGGGTSCDTGEPCAPPPTGACCVGFTCSIQIQAACEGTWLGQDSTCDDDPCAPPATGACCVEESCAIRTEAACTGQWLGADTTCEDSPCANPETLLVPQQYASIDEALAVSTPGDTVLVGPGIWTSTGAHVLNPLGRQVTIRSSAGPSQTTLDGEGARRVIRCAAGEGTETTIEGFTITGGAADQGAGIDIDYASHPVFINCIIIGNEATEQGGGVHCAGLSNPTFENCQFLNNTGGSSGGGIRIEDSSSPTFQQCTIAHNAAVVGGGLSVVGSASNPTLMDVMISDNSSQSLGGGVFCDTASITMMDSTVRDNHSDVVGGGLLLRVTNSTMTDCVVTGNTAERGAGLYVFQGEPTFTNCDIQSNTASLTAGGIFAKSTTMTLHGCLISRNITASGGGGLVIEGTPIPTLLQSSVCYNRPEQIEGSWTDEGDNTVLSRCDDGCLDVDGDTDVDTADLVTLVAYWGQSDAICDVDASGQVEMTDLLMLLDRWGPCPTTP